MQWLRYSAAAWPLPSRSGWKEQWLRQGNRGRGAACWYRWKSTLPSVGAPGGSSTRSRSAKSRSASPLRSWLTWRHSCQGSHAVRVAGRSPSPPPASPTPTGWSCYSHSSPPSDPATRSGLTCRVHPALGSSSSRARVLARLSRSAAAHQTTSAITHCKSCQPGPAPIRARS
jgi:hypothetical protein